MNYLIPAILTLIVSIIGGVVLWLIKRERALLEYEITSSDVFPTKDGVGKYFIIKLTNAGNKHIENISYSIELPYGKISSIAISRPELISDTEQGEVSFKTKLPLMNPREYFSLTMTTQASHEPHKPKLLARATGATAVPKKNEKLSPYLESIITVTTTIATLAVALTLWNSWKVPKLENQINDRLKQLDATKVKSTLDDLESKANSLAEKQKILEAKYEKGDPDSQQIIFSILNKTGLSYLLPDLINVSSDSVIYWKTGLLIFSKFMTDPSRRKQYISAMEQMVTQGNMAPASKGFNLYLLGKMEQYVGNPLKANEYFGKCKNETPLMYNHLMEQDSFFDLKTVEKNLRYH